MIGIIAAMAEEIMLLKDKMEHGCKEYICGTEFFSGSIADNEVVICECGIGKVNSAIAATILISHFECDFIINTGIAGGISNVNSEDVIIASKLMYHDVDVTAFNYEYGQIPRMPKYFIPDLDLILNTKRILNKLSIPYKEATVFSGDSFVTNLGMFSKVDISQNCIAEMEGASIAQVCVKAGVRFLVLRYVSDIVGKENQISDYLAFESKMANRSANICFKIIQEFSII